MGMLLFKKRMNNANISEYSDVLSFNQIVANLLSQDKFIAKSDYYYLIDEYKQTYDFFYNTNKTNLLSIYCKKNKLNQKEIMKFLEYYSSFENKSVPSLEINQHNEEYINYHLTREKKYLDNILKEVDPLFY